MAKYIIDTDIGDDIDDAFAIEYAVNAGLDIIGVTTVFRSTYLRAELTSYLLSLMGRGDIPVYAGEDQPIKEATDATQKPERNLSPEKLAHVRASGEKWLPHYLDEAKGCPVAEQNGVDFIIEATEKYGKELAIFAIGPLTNLAKAIEKAPETMKKLGRIYLMGGNVAENAAEWNVRLDPEAAYTVFHSGIEIYQFGSDKTWKHCMVLEDELARIDRADDVVGKANLAMLNKWRKQPLYVGRTPCMHDSLPIVAAIEPDCVKYKKTPIKVILEGEGRSMTVKAESFGSGAAAVYVATEVDEARFRESMWKNIFPKAE